MLLSFVAWVVVGALAGWVVSLIQKRDFRRDWTNYTLLGMAGSVVGGLLMRLIGGAGGGDFSLYSILVAVAGAFAVTWIVGKLRGT